MNSDIDQVLNRIEKDRYLISCKCLICNKEFKDIILGSKHVYEEHSDREKRNVIENLSWDLRSDLRRWEILQELKSKRDMIISKLSDNNAIKHAKIPDIVEIQRKKADISEIMKSLMNALEKNDEISEDTEEEEEIEDIDEEIDERDFESLEAEEEEEVTSTRKEKNDEESELVRSKSSKVTKKRNLCELLEREVEKYEDSIKRLSMASEVEKILKGKMKEKSKLDQYFSQLDYFLGVAKAAKIIKRSNADLDIII